jgi:hypothetical protein
MKDTYLTHAKTGERRSVSGIPTPGIRRTLVKARRGYGFSNPEMMTLRLEVELIIRKLEGRL